MLLDVVEQAEVTRALESEAQKNNRVWAVWEGLSWRLARRHRRRNGADADYVMEGDAGVFYIMKQSGRVIGYESISVLYEIEDEQKIIVHAIKFTSAAPFV